jgi:hypothetical protein
MAPLGEPRMLTERIFRQEDVPAVRRFAEAFGARAGIGSARVADFVLGVSEAAACATAWGPCTARVRLWISASRACCEVRGDATALREVAHSSAWQDTPWQGTPWHGTPWPDGPGGEEAALRRCVLKQLCDYVSVASGPGGSLVFLSMSVASG